VNSPSDLEKFLQQQSTHGETIDTEQSFSLAREKALEKLAAFQMPFSGAWALKLVQCAVASDCFTALKIDLSVKITTFTFSGIADFTIDELEQVFFNPDHSPRTDLAHLTTALRVMGYNNMHPFWLQVSGEDRALVWDGERMAVTATRPNRVNPASLSLVFSNYPIGETPGAKGYFANMIGAGFNADLTRIFTQYAHVCPKPLIVDGRRLDALQNDSSHGFGPMSQLLVLGFRDCDDLPRLSIPPHTLQNLKPVNVAVEGRLSTASEATRTVPEHRTHYSFAYLIAAHMKRVKQGKNYVWKDFEGTCTVSWVLDGIVIQEEALTSWPEFCSAGCIISASGIPTDITGFRLKTGEEQMRRLEISKRLLAESLDEVDNLDFDAMDAEGRKENRVIGSIIGVAGLMTALVNPGFTLLLGGVGAFVYLSGTDAAKKKDKISRSVNRLKENLGDSVS